MRPIALPYKLLFDRVSRLRKTLSAQQAFNSLDILEKNKTLSQDAQKARPARPQRAKRRRRTLRYAEPLSDARTPLADFFSILLVPSGMPMRIDVRHVCS